MPSEPSLARASHILFHQGILDAFGHVSTRDPNDPGSFLLSRNLAPALVRDSDILRFDLDGQLRSDGTPGIFLERFIHAAIYKQRSDVAAIVHSHAPSVLPYGLVPGANLCPVCHMAGFIGRNTPVFEIRNHCGDSSSLLISSLDLGVHLANCLGNHPLVLMRGHGMTVVGESIQQVVFRAIYTEANARIQSSARQLGDVVFLSEMEALAADAANNSQIQRAWNVWSLQAECAVAPLHVLQAQTQSVESH